MRILRAICGELLGLFVDDGSLAAALLAWCAAVAIMRAALSGFVAPAAWGAVLAIGCVAILLTNVRRAAALRARRR